MSTRKPPESLGTPGADERTGARRTRVIRLSAVAFIAVDAGDNPAIFTADPASFNREDATFLVSGKEGRGIPAGKYRIAVGQKMVGEPPAEVETMNEMFSRKNSTIIREVTSEANASM